MAMYSLNYDILGNSTQVVEAQTQGMVADLTSIHYTYDPLHRLTQASYGGILPEYQYTYDALGNITQSVEMGVTTAKTYNNANQLATSTTSGTTTTYTYDGAGNLIRSQAGGIAGARNDYHYNQRNLLVGHALGTLTPPQIQTHFVYDGNGDRVQEIDYTSGQPSTTTYTNDPVGLTQVLVASKAGQTTYNLWGMDLLAQDDGQTQKLTLLTDALGSVRGQMRGTNLQASTSYGPYGAIHQQTGTSQTSYGYTGEQFHAGTGLLYLRARYYSPALHAFTGRDQWIGDNKSPITLNGYNYANANPLTYTDPSGFRSYDTNCEAWPNYGIWNLRKLCLTAESPNNSDEVLDARERIYKIIRDGGHVMHLRTASPGYYWAAYMLNHFLEGNGQELSIYGGKRNPFNGHVEGGAYGMVSFINDSGIRRGIDLLASPRVNGDEPDIVNPLLHRFVQDYLQFMGCDSFANYTLNGIDGYIINTERSLVPHADGSLILRGSELRPYDSGFFSAFGHVVINGTFQGIKDQTSSGSVWSSMSISLSIEDTYTWFDGKSTPLPMPLTDPLNFPLIPHSWALSLMDAGRAHAFNFKITWDETHLISTSNFDSFWQYGR